jgi:hypothetical protein
MANTIGFATVQKYLSGLAQLNGTIGGSPHRVFWNIPYEQFITASVPNVNYRGNPIPLIWKEAPVLSPLFMILVEQNGWGNKEQMPAGGPFITQDDLAIPMGDGTTVTGKQARAELEAWFKTGCPKEPTPIPGT